MRRFPRKIVATTLGVLVLARFRRTRRRGAVRSIATFTAPDGTPWVVTLGYGQLVSIWDAGSGRRLQKIPVSDDPIRLATVASSSGAALLAVLTADQRLQIWDPSTADHVGELQAPGASRDSRMAAWNTPAGRPRLAVTCGDAGIRILDPEARESDWTVVIDPGSTTIDLATWRTPDAQLRLASSSDGATLLWDPETGRKQGQLEGPHDRPSSITTHESPERTLLVVLDEQGGYVLWDPQTTKQIASRRLPVRPTPGLGVSLPGLRIATGHDDGTVRVTDPATGDQLHETRFRRPIRALAPLPDGLAVGLDNGWRMVRLPT